MPGFVILEHRWDGVHWDFMLEREGVLKTWTVPEPIRPGIDSPARQLTDHRLVYLDYEGPISGGRGTVCRIARGDYDEMVWDNDEIRVRLNGTQLKGEVWLRRVDSVGLGNVTSEEAGWRFHLGNVD